VKKEKSNSTALWQGMHPHEHTNILVINWVSLAVCFAPFAFSQPDYRALFAAIILVVPAALSLAGFITGHWREFFVHLGMSAAVLFAFYTGWAPPIVVLFFIGTGMLTLVFLSRPWGGWYFSIMSMIVTVPIAMSMMGFNSELPTRIEDEIRIIVFAALMVGINGFAIARQQRWSTREMQRARNMVTRMQEVHYQFAEAISHAPNLHEALWLVADLCIPALDLEDCVIYTMDHDTHSLEQVAAYGPKSLSRGEILSPLKIKMGQGIVGTAALNKSVVKEDDAQNNPDYILDDNPRNSELAVPIMFEGKVFGVIDSEHSEKNFFSDEHVVLFQLIASLCANKIAELQLIDSKLEKATAERELNQINQVEVLRNTFLNNLSHDLRTPLSLIKGPLQELARHTDATVIKLSEVALRNANRLNEMVSGLLDMHKLERGALHPTYAPADLPARLREWHALFIHEAEKRNIDYPLLLINVETLICDAGKIGQIVQNLLSNAFKFTPDGGTIKLDVHWKNNELTLYIDDSGPGIPAEKHEQVFERFYKIDSDSHIEGTGLGLAMVKEFSEMLDGSVALDESPLGGARFTVTIPAEESQEMQLAQGTFTEAELAHKPLVVVVEDHPEMNEFIVALLSDEYEVRSVFNAEDGWNLVENYLPDLIITDLMLPGMSGEMLCKRIKSSLATDHLPVLALSAKQSTDTKIELYSYGADNYLTKPFDSEELRSVVRGLIDQRTKLKVRYGQGSQRNGSTRSEGMRRIDEIIRSEMANPDFGPRDLEKAIGVNRNQLQRKVKTVTGYTPVEYIRITRLEHARNLLRQGNHNVSDAAYACGFNQLAYFSKAYKAHFGVSPKEDVVRENMK